MFVCKFVIKLLREMNNDFNNSVNMGEKEFESVDTANLITSGDWFFAIKSIKLCQIDLIFPIIGSLTLIIFFFHSKFSRQHMVVD